MHRPRDRRTHARFHALARACPIIFFPFSAHAATWDAGAADLLWTSPINWSTDAPVTPADAITFTGATSASLLSTVTSIIPANVTALSLAYTQSTPAVGVPYHTTRIADGATLTLTGAAGPANSILHAGSPLNSTNSANVTYASIEDATNSTTGGALTLANPAADLIVRQWSSTNATNARHATLDLSRLSTLTATVRHVLVGSADAAASRSVGTLLLASRSTVTAKSIQVGNNLATGASAAPGSRLFFGQDTTLNTALLLIGGRDSANAAAAFAPAVTAGALTLRGNTGPDSRADLHIAAQPVADITVAINSTNHTVDLTGSTPGTGRGAIDARLTSLVIGRAAAGPANRNASGLLAYDRGHIDADAVLLADDNASSTAAVATATLRVLNSARLTVNTSFTLARRTGTGNPAATLTADGPAAVIDSAAPLLDAGGASTITLANGATLRAPALGSPASPIDTISVSAATLHLTPTATTPSSHITSLTLTNSATATLAPFASGVLAVSTLSLDDSSTLDLGDNSLLLDYTGDTPLPTIRSLIATAARPDLIWTGTGLTSSAAGGFATHHAPGAPTALGYSESSQYKPRTGATTYADLPLDDSTLIVTHTLLGDATLDGLLTDADIDLLIANYGSTSATWTTGDFTYDGKVTDRDLDLLAATLAWNHPAITITPAALARLNTLRAPAPIPEPSAALTASAVACLIAARRRPCR